MNRSIWWAVLITVTILAGAGFASRLPWRDGAALMERGRALTTRGEVLVRQGTATLVSLREIWLAWPAQARAGLLASAGFLFLLALALTNHRRQPRRLALRMLRRGGAVARVARRTRLAQDAIRTLSHSERA